MAAANPMYSMKRVNNPVDVPNPDVMYKLKSYQQHSSAGEAGDVSNEFVELERRQDKILEQLRKLKTEVDSLVNSGSKPAGAEGKLWEIQVQPCPAFKKGEIVQDLVITADPTSPPLSVIVLCNMLSQQYSVFTACYTHSTLPKVTDAFKSALGQSNGITRNAADMAISLKWKDNVSRPSLSSSRSNLEGEAVISRYLARLLKRPSPWCYETGHLAGVTEQDYYMDLLLDLEQNTDQKRRSAALDTLNNKLSRSSYLGGNAASLADLVLWSGVLRFKKGGKVQLSSAGNAWLDRCSQLPEFKAATVLL